MGRALGAAVAVAVAALLCACDDGGSGGQPPPSGTPSTSTASSGAVREEHLDGRGPLSASSGSGGSSINPPTGAGATWEGSFGSFQLCSTDGSDIVLEGARTEASVDPLEVKTWLREVTTADIANATGKTLDDLAPFGTSWGSPPHFNQSYVDIAPAGAFTEDIAGTEVNQSCDGLADESQGFKEFVVALRVDGGGGQISDTYLDYTADGTPMTLHIEWQMIACGTNITEQGVCGN